VSSSKCPSSPYELSLLLISHRPSRDMILVIPRPRRLSTSHEDKLREPRASDAAGLGRQAQTLLKRSLGDKTGPFLRTRYWKPTNARRRLKTLTKLFPITSYSSAVSQRYRHRIKRCAPKWRRIAKRSQTVDKQIWAADDHHAQGDSQDWARWR